MQVSFWDCFQLICLGFFLFVFLGRTLHLRFRHSVTVMTLGVAKKGLRQFVELLFFAGLVVWIVEVFLYAWPGESRLFRSPFNAQLLDSTPAKWGGMALITAGMILFVWALASFGRSWRIGIDNQSPGRLITGGIFALSRNPIFVFMDLYFIGTFLINGTLIFLIFALLIIAGLHYQILQEETFLSSAYGQDYQTYCHKTARYFGRRLTPKIR